MERLGRWGSRLGSSRERRQSLGKLTRILDGGWPGAELQPTMSWRRLRRWTALGVTCSPPLSMVQSVASCHREGWRLSRIASR